MKSIAILIICIFIISSNIYAQEKINYGLKFGMVSSDFSVERKESSLLFSLGFKEIRNGPGLGFFANVPINKVLIFDADLLYLQKGAEDEFQLTTIENPEGTGETVSYDYQLDYLQFNGSINPKINFERIELQGKFGLSLAVLLETKGAIIFKDADDFSTGYFFGGKIIFNDVLKRPIFVEIIRNIDFNPFYKSGTYELTNNAWMFSLGFYYN